jgi:cytidylate kinase
MQKDRDARDAARVIAPMVPAADAITIDTTNMTMEELITLLERHVRERGRDCGTGF